MTAGVCGVSKTLVQILFITGLIVLALGYAGHLLSNRQNFENILQASNSTVELIQYHRDRILTAISQFSSDVVLPATNQLYSALYRNSTDVQRVAVEKNRSSTQDRAMRPFPTDWKPEALALARQAYSSWKKVHDANEPDTVAGVVSRLNNTAFKWVSQRPISSAQACPSPPCYENKMFGGDEYFVLIMTADYRQHVATCTDHEDGTYTFRFDATCGEEVVGNMSVVLEFSKGQSLQPTKQISFLKRMVMLHAPNTVIRADAAVGKHEMAETGRSPAFMQAPGLFDRFDTIMAFGCSLTRQVTNEAMKQSGRKILYITAASPLNSLVLHSKFIASMKPWEDMYNASANKSRFAIIFNSGIWDVLLQNPVSESKHPPEDMYFDHLQALSNWTDYIRAKFPEAAIFFKETTALHAHETMCSHIKRPKIKYKCQQRNMFMAGALTDLLRKLQNTVMRAKNIPILLQYDTTFRHPSFALDGDGRHFVGPLNDLMWKSWTYIDGKWTTQLLCPKAFYAWMSSTHPEGALYFSKGLARSYARTGIQL
jgi:hypothetical protein